MKVVPLVLAAVCGCSFSGKIGGSSFSGSPTSSPSSSAGTFQSAPMPNLFGRTPSEAATLLKNAGFVVVSAEERTDDECSEGADHAMAPQGAICDQSPPPEIDTDPREVRLKYTLEHDAFDHGGTGDAAWRRMPAVVGMSLADARAALTRAKLPADQFFDIVDARDDDRCRPGVVCEQSPAPKDRMRLASHGRLVVGASTPGTPAAPAPGQPAPASQPSSTPDTYF